MINLIIVRSKEAWKSCSFESDSDFGGYPLVIRDKWHSVAVFVPPQSSPSAPETRWRRWCMDAIAFYGADKILYNCLFNVVFLSLTIRGAVCFCFCRLMTLSDFYSVSIWTISFEMAHRHWKRFMLASHFNDVNFALPVNMQPILRKGDDSLQIHIVRCCFAIKVCPVTAERRCCWIRHDWAVRLQDDRVWL